MGVLEVLHKFDKGHDEAIDKMFLMGSPVNVVLILFAYLVFVLKLGPMLMKHSQAFGMKKALFVYNFVQIVYCTYIFSKATKLCRLREILADPDCKFERTGEESLLIYSLGWHYLMTKFLDLMDTVFFVLRKKPNQITFLHIYHHTFMVLYSWLLLKYRPEDIFIFIGFTNCFVHIIMYSYYFLSALGPQYQKYLWWKKYMTTIQLTQFVIFLTFFAVIYLKNCQIPKVIIAFTFGNTFLFLYLFLKFYQKTYKSQPIKVKEN